MAVEQLSVWKERKKSKEWKTEGGKSGSYIVFKQYHEAKIQENLIYSGSKMQQKSNIPDFLN